MRSSQVIGHNVTDTLYRDFWEADTACFTEGLTLWLTGAHKACPKHAVYQRPC